MKPDTARSVLAAISADRSLKPSREIPPNSAIYRSTAKTMKQHKNHRIEDNLEKYLKSMNIKDILYPISKERKSAPKYLHFSKFIPLSLLQIFYLLQIRIVISKNSTNFRGPEKNYNIGFFWKSFNQQSVLSDLIESFQRRNMKCIQLQYKKTWIPSKMKPYLIKYRVITFFIKQKIDFNFQKLNSPEEKKALAIFLVNYVYFIYVLVELDICFLFFANDHNPEHRVANLAANDLGIKTIYVQHAAVSRKFPSLEFDYAFLDGKFSESIYNEILTSWKRLRLTNKNTVIHKVGNLKRIRKSNSGPYIGFAPPLNFPIEDAKALAQKFKVHNLKVAIRFHPREQKTVKNMIMNVFIQNKIVFFLSENYEHSLGQFFDMCNSLISRESSILLDSSLSDTLTINWSRSNSENFDYYEFIKTNLCYHCDSIDDIFSILKESNYADSEKFKFAKKMYSESYDTLIQGREHEQIVDIFFSVLADTE
ncbi:MAG: hypothetical protein LAT53_12265 [Idiomarina sp.]|nr:hypothetical protein [Idiomarina sp.]